VYREKKTEKGEHRQETEEPRGEKREKVKRRGAKTE
jgi:hypothetical protein